MQGALQQRRRNSACGCSQKNQWGCGRRAGEVKTWGTSGNEGKTWETGYGLEMRRWIACRGSDCR